MFDPLFNPRMPFTAVDLSDRSVKLARVEHRRGKAEFRGALSLDIPEGLVLQGKVQDAKGLSKALASIFHSSEARKLAAPGIAMTLPEEHCFLRIVQVPKLAPDELEQAIRWEAEAAIPLPSADAVISWQVIKNSLSVDHVDVLVSGAPRDLAESYAEVIHDIPAIAVAFEPESLSIVRALLTPKDKDGVLIIDVGREHTGVILTYEHSVRMTANIPLAAHVFTERIADAKKISLDDAEKLKRQWGISQEGEGAAIREILLPVLSDLAKQAQQFFGFFETHIHIDRLSTSPAVPPSVLVSPTAPETKDPAALPAENTSTSVKKTTEAAPSPPVASPAPASASEIPGLPRITRVLLTGGDALLKGLPEYLSETFGVPVSLGDPFCNLGKSPKNFDRSVLFTTAMGLSLYPTDISSL